MLRQSNPKPLERMNLPAETILAPVDFSEDAMRAFRYAAHLAETSAGK